MHNKCRMIYVHLNKISQTGHLKVNLQICTIVSGQKDFIFLLLITN